ncbi:MAG: hypothetical protein AB7O88_23780, partial [Reyranellaceae bacterium]
MKRASFSVAAVALTLCVGLIAVLAPDAAHAATVLPNLHDFSWADLVQAAPPLAALRLKLTDLTKRAEAKKAEIGDDTEPDAIRSIEQEHAAILAEVDEVRAAITEQEAEEGARTRTQPVNPAEAATRAVAAERDRVATITELAQRANAVDLGAQHVRSGTDVDAFRTALLDHMVELEAAAPTNSNVRAQLGTEAADRVRAAKVEALSYGLGAPVPQAGPSEAARQFMGRGLVDLAADSIDYRGGRMLNARQIDDIFTRASMTTSDFPIIFEGAINRTLEQRYALATPTFKRFARKRNFRDFRPDTTVKLGDFPLLQKVLESGEIKYGSFVEGKEQVQAFSYAIALRVTRQMLINDDLGAITELLTSYGATVALFEEVTFYASAFNGKLADGKDVYHADHTNLASAGTVIDVENVGKARAAMSKQKSTGGNPLLANPP